MPTPFLRWAGGKSWLARRIHNNIVTLPKFANYHEPFLGGGAIYFSIDPPKSVFLSDLNQELINTYIAIRDYPYEVINILKNYKNTESFYYSIRASYPTELVEQAARFIYLNHTSFNGIYRVNKNGVYNVPYGYRRKNFLNEMILLEASQYLQNTHINYGDFEIVKKNLKPNDLVFLDPPYTVSHLDNENGFIKYNQQLFSLADQLRLKNLINFIRENNAFYILTNTAHETIKNIFYNDEDRMIEVCRASLVGGENAHRGQVSEYIFTNIQEAH
ncbi:DNA adenine methylase [Harryflintia acetispora]|uniref:DNA adenine methylase n=1 Tax=Harryflintia acetispora TaxID=1849041 RepID=UPI001899596C|nr:Dam family site-specific DNA-(adenine-N6)-methyltransferase [Harryflintia acetispora]